jgi:hypothetical protein
MSQTLVDPAALVESLDADAIERRLVKLDREADALRVLLRAARARERRRPFRARKGTAPPVEGGGRA